MKTAFNLKQRLDSQEVQRFEKRLSEQYDRPMRIGDVPIKNFVDVDSGLLETKVATTFLKGATDEAGFWQDLINVVQMKSPQEEVPIISQRDIIVHTGKLSRAAVQQSGGNVRKVSLDTRNDDKIRYVYLPIDREDIRMHNFDLVEKSILVAGQAFAKHILSDVLKLYVNNAGNTQARGSDLRFQAITKGIGLNRIDGFGCTAIVFEGTDFDTAILEETSAGTMPWLSQLPAGMPLGDNFGRGIGSSGLVGRMWGRIPVYVVGNDSTLDSNILCVDVPAAAAFGFAPGGEIRTEQEIKRIDDLIENAISAKYDLNTPDDDGTGKSNAVAKVTGA